MTAHLALVVAFFAFGTASTQQPEEPSVAQLEAALERDSTNAELHVRLGVAYWQQDDFSRALEVFQRAVSIAPESAEAQNWLGVALLAKSDLPGGIAALRKAIALDPRHGRAYSNLGSALVKSGSLEEAVAVFRKALTLEPNSVGAQLNLGMALREAGKLDEALEYLQRVVKAEPNHEGIHYELGQTLRQNGDLGGAIAALEKAVELNPELREGYYALGAALKQQAAARRSTTASGPSVALDKTFDDARDAAARGDLAAARQKLDEVLRIADTHAEAHNLLGFIFGQQGDLPSALRHLERAIALRPDLAEAHYNLGVALWYSGSNAKAIAELRKSIELDAASGASHAFLGTALRDSGDLAGARASLQRAIALLPPTASVYIDLGITYLRAGELSKALGQLEAGLNAPAPAAPAPDWDAAIAALREEVKPGSDRGLTPVRPPSVPIGAAAHNVLGRMLGRRGAPATEVAAAFREAIRLAPELAEAHNNLGLVLIQGGDDQAGIAALREAVRLAPDYAEARANLGAALTPTDPAEAVRELEKAVALAPASVNAQFNLSVAYGATEGGSVREIDQLRKVIALEPTFARAHVALGKALLRNGSVPDAIASLEEAVRLDSRSGEAHYQLGLALARAGRREDAARELKLGRELVASGDRTQNASLDLAEGLDALGNGDLEQAVASFRRAIKLVPESGRAHGYLGTALEKQGDLDGASAAYRKALELNPADRVAKENLDRLMVAGSGDRGIAGSEGRGDASLPAVARSAKVGAADDPGVVAEVEGYIREGRFAEVEPKLAEYVKGRPASAWGWYALGYSLFAQRKIGESIKALAKSLELDIRNAEAHKILGRNLLIIGRFDAAQLEFEQGIRYKPDSAEMHYNLGKLFSIQDNWGPARKAFEAALRIDPAYLEALDGLGFALEALGDDPAAVAAYEKAVAINQQRQGSFAEAHVSLSAFYNRTGDGAKALEYARQAIELAPESDRAWFQKGRADERLGQLKEAADALSRAIVLNPRASSYYYVLAGVYRRMGWAEESREALDAFKRLEKESSELEKLRRRGADTMAAPSAPGRIRE